MTTNRSTFSLRDKKGCTVANLSQCLCTGSNGDIKLSQANSTSNAEVLSFDLLLEDLKIQDGRRCDFVVTPQVGDEYIVFCELTRAQESSVEPFIPKEGDIPQPNTVKPITSVVIQFNGVLVRTSILTVINIKRPSLVGEKFDL